MLGPLLYVGPSGSVRAADCGDGRISIEVPAIFTLQPEGIMPPILSHAGCRCSPSGTVLARGETKTIIDAVERQRSASAVRLASYCDGNAAVTIADYSVRGADCRAATC